MKRISIAVFILLITVLSIYAGADKTEEKPDLLSHLREIKSLNFCGEKVPLDNPEVRERFEKEFMLSIWNEPQVLLWIKRSGRYFPHIETELKANGLPDDLKYVAIAESALQPHVGSSKGAIGFWQFTKATGKNYDLKVNEEIDERRSIFKSTEAAIDYFKALNDTLGSWTLSAAAFNMGEHGLITEMLIQDTADYYELYLPIETQRYIFRILSAKLILSNPHKYGFNVTEEDFYQPLKYDWFTFEVSERIPIRIIAEAANTTFKRIKDLNPELRGYYLSEGEYTLRLPEKSARNFLKKYELSLNRWKSEKEKQIYIVQKGDNLSIIAEYFHIPLPALLLWNNLTLKDTIHPGDELYISE